MRPQSQQPAGSADSAQPISQATNQPGQVTQDSRPPVIVGYPQAPPLNGREGNLPPAPPVLNPLGGVNLPNQRLGPKFNAMKGNMPNMPLTPNFDLPLPFAGPPRPPYNGQFFVLPNGPMFNGLPQVGPFGPGPLPGPDQPQVPYFPPNVYPNMNPMVPGPIQPFSWPFVVNYDMQDPMGHKRNNWGSSDEHKPVAPSTNGSGNQSEYSQNPIVPNIDAPVIPGLPFNAGSQVGQPCLPLQMMKTATGYILQDLEVLTQQDPPIPRAVPAMWTNPSDLTLAKCLENREGITNVYIRGFLPETTDDMLFSYASRFGKIDRCKAIVDLDTGLCKG